MYEAFLRQSWVISLSGIILPLMTREALIKRKKIRFGSDENPKQMSQLLCTVVPDWSHLKLNPNNRGKFYNPAAEYPSDISRIL